MDTMIEVWKPILGFEGYEVSNQGQVRSFHKRVKGNNRGWFIANSPQRILKQSVSSGYLFVALMDNNSKRRIKNIHSLILLAFVGPRPDGMVACHNNDVKDDNRLDNLRYDTQKNNVHDFINQNKGVGSNASLTLEKARDIKGYLENHTILEASEKFKVGISIVKDISSGLSYVSLRNMKSRTNWKQERAEKIRELYATGQYTQEKLADEFNLSISGISRIVNHQRLSNEKGIYPQRDRKTMSAKKTKKFIVQTTPIEYKALKNIMGREQLNRAEAIRFIIRHYAKLYNLWPVLTCPDCDSTTIDHIGGNNYRCECGYHFAI